MVLTHFDSPSMLLRLLVWLKRGAIYHLNRGSTAEMESFWLIVYLLVAAAAVIQAVLVVIQTAEHRRFARSRLEFLRRRRPVGRVALFVPCKGVDVGLEENLHALLRQDYGNYEVTFVLESAEDPAYEVIQRVTAAHPQVDWGVRIAGQAEWSGQKVHNLLAATAQLPRDVEYLAFVDSDARPNPYWLRAMVAHLRRGEVGAVTGYRWFIPQRPSLANHILYSINCGYALLFGRNNPNYVWGGSWAIRRELFDRLEVRRSWEGTLSDDLVVSRLVRQAGLHVEFEPAAMVASPLDRSFGQMLGFIRRQYVIAKHYTPGGWLLALAMVSLSNLGLWSCLGAAVWSLATAAVPLGVPVAVIALLYGLGAYRGFLRQELAYRYFPEFRQVLRRPRRFDIWAAPLANLVHWCGLVASIPGRTIRWRGIVYRIGRGGRIRWARRREALPVAEPAGAEPAPRYRKAG